MHKSILTLAVLAALAVAAPTQAGDAGHGHVTLDINLASYHTQSWAREALNQKNPGLGMTYRFSRSWALSAGGYWNSYRRPTAYALMQWTPLQFGDAGQWHVDAGIAAGLASGYRRKEIALRPLAGGALVRVVSPSGVSVNVFGVPGTGGSKSGFVGFQLSVPMQ